jgi:hypothetical protein
MWTEIAEEVRRLDGTPPALRRFGVVVGVVFLLIAAFVWWRTGWRIGFWSVGFGSLGALLVLGGLLSPRMLRGVHRAWMALAFTLGFMMTRLILTITFVSLVIPIGLILRVFGKDLLSLRRAPPDESYWIPRPQQESVGDRLRRLY